MVISNIYIKAFQKTLLFNYIKISHYKLLLNRLIPKRVIIP